MDNLLLHFDEGSARRLSCATLKLSDFGNACSYRSSYGSEILLTELVGN
jgi:hypothetical protein